jgi:hypothetical protein
MDPWKFRKWCFKQFLFYVKVCLTYILWMIKGDKR